MCERALLGEMDVRVDGGVKQRGACRQRIVSILLTVSKVISDNS